MIVLGEIALNSQGFLRLGANQTIFKAFDKRLVAKHQESVLGAAAFKLFAVQLADKIQRQAVFKLRAPVRRLVADAVFDNIVYALVGFFGGNFSHRLFHLQPGEVGHFKIGQDFIGHGVGQIHFAVENPFDFLLVFSHLDHRLEGRALVAVLEGGVAAFGDFLLDDVAHQ